MSCGCLPVAESLDGETLAGFRRATGGALLQLGAEFREFGLQRAEVVLRGLILLSTRHLELNFLDPG